MSQRLDIHQLARLSGATAEDGSRAELVFCMTAGELEGFAKRLADEIRKRIVSEAEFRKTRFNEDTVRPIKLVHMLEEAVGLPAL